MKKIRPHSARTPARRLQRARAKLLRVARGIFLGALQGVRRLRAANDPHA